MFKLSREGEAMRLIFWVILFCLQSHTAAEPLPADRALEVFTAYFEAGDSGARVLGVRLRENSLTVNFSEEFLNYGGNEYEKQLIAELKETARTVPGVEYLTVWIEGELRPLNEGRIVEDEDLF